MSDAPMTNSTRPTAVAATGHTLIVLGILVVITVTTARSTGGTPVAAAGSNHFAQYGVLLGHRDGVAPSRKPAKRWTLLNSYGKAGRVAPRRAAYASRRPV